MNDQMLDLADALGGMNHTITDENGQLAEITATDEIPSEEQTTITETEPDEQSPDTQQEQETAETNPEVAEDEDGKKYVPEGRFKEVYAQKKELERELQKFKSTQTTRTESPMTTISGDRATMLETELLHQTLPQFNPNSPDYSEVLDEMGAEIYQASFRFDSNTQSILPTITKLEAARRALDRVKKLGVSQDKVRQEVRVVKSQQADSGFTAASKKVAEKNPDDMTLEEKEAYLKKTGQW